MSEQFGLLYAVPSALEGAASVLDIGNTLTDYNTSTTPDQADFHAIRSDWRAIGDDLRAAAARFVKDSQQQILHG